ncbi:MAG TPA: NAD-dependent epimerase/dehydratase family protein [Polyangiaceae bacterium]|jgi:nucleoside-diphosphate-sugar epimerase
MSELHLVTGGAGYFGTLLVERLRAAGVRVRIFDINDAEERPAEVEMVRGDIRHPDALRRAVEGVSVVHHNVAMVPLAKDKAAFWSVNRDGARHLLEAALAAGARKVVSMSSSAVFGAPSRNPVDDATVPRPQEDYGRAKLAAEELCHEYVARGLDVTIIRPRTIMGHGRLGIMQILFEWVRQGKNIPVLGRGDNLYQFVHADDLADAAIKAAERPGAATYNVGADRFGTMRETLEGLVSHAGTGSRVVSVPMSPAVAMMKVTSRAGMSPLGAYHSLMYGRAMYFDLARTKRELEWTPRFGNVEMFCDSYDWYLGHRDEVLKRHGASHHRSPVRQGVLRAVGWALSFAPG